MHIDASSTVSARRNAMEKTDAQATHVASPVCAMTCACHAKACLEALRYHISGGLETSVLHSAKTVGVACALPLSSRVCIWFQCASSEAAGRDVYHLK